MTPSIISHVLSLTMAVSWLCFLLSEEVPSRVKLLVRRLCIVKCGMVIETISGIDWARRKGEGMSELTIIETMILRAVNFRPNDWLNCHGAYLGEVLALQCKGLITTRRDGNQLQVKAK